jgi:hypothetical protein
LSIWNKFYKPKNLTVSRRRGRKKQRRTSRNKEGTRLRNSGREGKIIKSKEGR